MVSKMKITVNNTKIETERKTILMNPCYCFCHECICPPSNVCIICKKPFDDGYEYCAYCASEY